MNGDNLLKVAIGLALGGFVLFGQSIDDPFHFDDALITGDVNIANPAAWRHFLNPLHLRQLTFFSFYLNHLATGNNPTSYHLVNVALHVANSILFFVILSGLVDRRMAVLAAAVFLAHPIQTEPVMYVYQRSILLACFFSLLALLALFRNRRWLMVLFFIAAFESKESAIAIPVLLSLLVGMGTREAAVPERSEWGTHQDVPLAGLGYRFVAKLFVFAVAMAALALALLAYRDESTVGIGAASKVSPVSYFLTEARVIYTYLRLLVFPFPQSLEYDFAWVHRVGILEVAHIAGLLGLLIAGVWLARMEKLRITGYAILAFLVLLTPTSSIIPSADAAFEHRLYLPMLAFSVFVASVIGKLRRPALIAAPLIAALCIVTIQRGTVWGSDIRLWEDTVRHVPNKARAWFNLGGAYMGSDPVRAQTAYKRTVELRPDYLEAYYDLGVIEQTNRGYVAAADYYRKAIELDSEYWPAWNNLGNTLLLLGDTERALSAFETTLRLNPNHWPSQYNIAVVHFNSGRFDQAIPRLRTALDWRPDFRDARYLLAVALTRTGQKVEAEREWQKLGNYGGQPPVPLAIPGPAR